MKQKHHPYKPKSRLYKLLMLVRHAAGLALLAYLILLMLICVSLDRFLFEPNEPEYRDGPDIVYIPVGQGEKIAAQWLPNPDEKYTILYSHGNAEDIGDIAPDLKELHDHGYAVMGYDYRGYGLSSGEPSEVNTYGDIEAVYHHLTVTLKIKPEQIISYGYSTGSGPATWLAAKYKTAGLVLEGAFTTALSSITRVQLFPVDRYRNIDLIEDIDVPLLIIHGTNDTIVPFSVGTKLYEAALQPRKMLAVKGAGHYGLRDEAGESFYEALRSFIPKERGIPEAD